MIIPIEKLIKEAQLVNSLPPFEISTKSPKGPFENIVLWTKFQPRCSPRGSIIDLVFAKAQAHAYPMSPVPIRTSVKKSHLVIS